MPNDQPDYTSVVNSQTRLLNGVTVAQDGAVHDLGQVTLPVGTLALELVWVTTTGISALNLIGSVTGLDWAQLGLAAFVTLSSPRAVVPVRQSFDPLIDIRIGFVSGGGTAKVWATALTDPSMVTLDSSEPGAVVIAGPNANTQLQLLQGSGAGFNAGVTSELAKAAPWQGEGVWGQLFNGTLAAGATAVLVAGVAGQSIRVLELVVVFTAAPPGSIIVRDSTGPTDLAVVSLLGQFPPPLRPNAKLSVGGSLTIANTSATPIGMGAFGCTRQAA